MSALKTLLLRSAGAMPFPLARHLGRIRSFFPYQHVVSDERLSHICQLYPYKGTREFIKDLDWLLRSGRAMHPDELRTIPPDSRKVALLMSFDDGYREIYDVIAPILLQKGIPAIFFINPAFIDNRELFYRCKLSLILDRLRHLGKPADLLVLERYLGEKTASLEQATAKLFRLNYLQRSVLDQLGPELGISFDEYLRSRKPFLTGEQVNWLSEKGFAIGAHSLDHPHYAHISQEEQVRQTYDSVVEVSRMTKKACRYFSFPHEDRPVTKDFFRKMEEKGVVDLLYFGVQNQKWESNPTIIHRYNCERPGISLEASTKAMQCYISCLSLVGKEQVVRS